MTTIQTEDSVSDDKFKLLGLMWTKSFRATCCILTTVNASNYDILFKFQHGFNKQSSFDMHALQCLYAFAVHAFMFVYVIYAYSNFEMFHKTNIS